MEDSRVNSALARLDAALARIDAARAKMAARAPDSSASASIMKLVNNHEKLREEVADALGDLDALIDEIEGTSAP